MSSKLSKTEWIIVIVAIVVCCSLIWVSTTAFGPAVTSDSIYYLSGAENIARGNGFIDYATNPIVAWPPLYSFLLGIVYRITGLPLLTIGLVINLICAALLILSSAIFYKRCLPQRRAWFIVGLLVTTTALFVYTCGATIGTDLLFLLFVVWFFLAAQNYLVSPRLKSLLLLSIIASIAPLVRWVGLALGFTGLILIIWLNRKHYQRLFRDAALFSILGFGPCLLWVFSRNYLNYGTLFGSRETSLALMIENVQFSFAKITYWFFPNILTDRVPALVIWLGIVILLLIVSRPKDWQGWLKSWNSPMLLPLLVFSITYFIGITLTVAPYDHPIGDVYDDRYQSPLFFLVLIGSILSLEYLVVAPRQEGHRQWVQIAILLVFCAWLIYPVYRIYKFTVLSLREGVIAYNAYNTRLMNESDIVNFIKQYDFEADLPIYTNFGEAFYLHTGLNSRPSPRDEENYKASSDFLEENYSHWPKEAKAYLVWIKNPIARNYYSPSQLSEITSWKKLYDRPDGQVLLVSPR